MGDIKVNPPSVQSFGTKSQQLFGQIRTQLEGLVNDAVAVNYFGPNAETFKKESGMMASEFADALTKDLGSIATAVQTSTSAISRSLGGNPVVIAFEGGTVPVPAVPTGDGSVGINLAALESLKSSSNTRFATIAGLLTTNLSNLTATDWTGNAKTKAVQSVSSYTTKAKGKVEEAKTSFGTRIDEQIEQAKLADKS